MLSVGIETKITILFLVLGISLRKLTSYLLSLHNCVPQQAVLQISPNQKKKKNLEIIKIRSISMWMPLGTEGQ